MHYVSVPMLLPIGTFLSIALNTTKANQVYAISGPVVFAITLTTVLYVGQWVGNDKLFGRLGLFVSLPVSPLAYGTGIALSALANSLISTSIILILGITMLGLHPSLAWLLLLPAYLLSFTAGSAVGLLIANSSKDIRVITSTAQVTAFAFALFAPVFYPIEVIPLPLRPIALLIPSTYSSILIRDSLIGDLNSFGLYVVPFTIMALVLLGIVVRTMQWRTK